MKREPWTNRELHMLEKHYADMANEDLALLMHTRTPNAIAHKASRMGLEKSQRFLDSPESGRFRKQPSKPIRPFVLLLLYITGLIWFRNQRFRANLKEGDEVLIRINKYKTIETTVYSITREQGMKTAGRVTYCNTLSDEYDVVKFSQVFPPSHRTVFPGHRNPPPPPSFASTGPDHKV